MLAELNEKFCVGLDLNPSLDRSTPPSLTVHNAGRTVFIGRSNLGRIAKAAAENGHMIVDLTAKGWIPKSGNIGKLCEKRGWVVPLKWRSTACSPLRFQKHH